MMRRNIWRRRETFLREPGEVRERSKVCYREDLFTFLKEVSFAHQGCIYLIKKYSKNGNIVEYYYNL